MPQAFVRVILAEQGELTPTSALIIQAENSHDVASFSASMQSLPRDLPELTPIMVKWGYEAANQQTFYGYVHHLEPLYVDNEQRIKVVCIGASLLLRSGLQQSWRYQSYDTIVRDIASTVYLSADVQSHPVAWPYTVVSGNAWNFMIELAQKIGYVLAVNGTEIRFLSPVELISRGMTAAPALSVDMFRPVVGLTMEEGKRRRRSYGMDTRTGRLYSSASGLIGAALELETDIVSGSPEEQASKLGGLELRNRFPFQADAECQGEAKVVQGSLVYIDKADDKYAGHWYVHQVEHEIRGAEYRNYLKLGRRTRKALPSFTLPGQPIRLRTDPYGEVTGTPPPTVLSNSRWRSGWARRAS